MPIELGVHITSIVSRDTIRQNHENQYFDQPSIIQVLEAFCVDKYGLRPIVIV
jgi:hypothetical protein